MGDLRTQMQNGRREAPPDDVALDRLISLRDRHRRNGRLLSAAVALALTGAMVVGGIAVLGHRESESPLGGGGNGSQAPTTAPTAAPVMSQPAAEPTPPGLNLVAAPGQFYYWRIVGVYPEGAAVTEVWYGSDGSGRAVFSREGPEAPPDESWAAGEYPYGDDLTELSTNPAALLEQLRARSGPEGASPEPAVTPLEGQEHDTGGLVRAIGDLLTNAPNLLPEQRQALYDVLGGLPTAEDLGSVGDPAGRPAVAVRIVTTDGSTTFYFDPHTHLFLSSKYGFDAPGAADDGVWYVVMEAGGIADSTGTGPATGQEFFPVGARLPEASGGPQAEATAKS